MGGSIVYLSVVFKVVHIHVDLIEELSSNRIISPLREVHTIPKVPAAQVQTDRHIRKLRRTVPETVVIQPDITLLNHNHQRSPLGALKQNDTQKPTSNSASGSSPSAFIPSSIGCAQKYANSGSSNWMFLQPAS